jgi:exopolysaccharide biosynthesis protein
MNKKMIPVFLVFIVAMILISAWPYILESRMPVNQFISKEKKSGMIPVVQFVADDIQVKIAEEAVRKFNENAPTKVIMKTFKISENEKSAQSYRMTQAGFVIIDADGKVAAQDFGVISFDALTEIIAGVHTH